MVAAHDRSDDVELGVAVYGGSMTYAYSFNIHDVERAINVGQSRFLKYGEGDSFISNTTERAVV